MAADKVLVVDDDLNIQRVLVFTLKQDDFDVQVASDGATGVEMAKSWQPDLILMDAGMPRVDGFQATQQIRAAEQGRRVPIIMLTSDDDVTERVKALRAGADDVIVKPFHPAELKARRDALLSHAGNDEAVSAQQATLGKVAVFYGAKGGVGTTTIALNTAIALSRDVKRKVALVDANLQFGDMRVFLDLGLDNASVVNAIGEPDLDAELLRTLMTKHHTGIELLLAPSSPEEADLIIDRQRQHPHAVTNLLDLCRRMYDYTVVDTTKAIDDFNLQLFDEADVIYVVMTADLSCLKNVRLVLETMAKLGFEQEKVQLVLNRSNAFTGINVNNAEGALGRRIDYQIINEYRGAISALNSGEPFMSSRPDGPLGKSVIDFARAMDKDLAVEHVPARAQLR